MRFFLQKKNSKNFIQKSNNNYLTYWHTRFGLLNYDLLLKNKNFVYGLNFKSSVLSTCQICQKGNITCRLLPYKFRKLDRKSSSSDPFGYMLVNLFERTLSIIEIVLSDSLSTSHEKYVCSPLVTRVKVLKNLLKKMVETLTGKKIEYCSKEFHEFVKLKNSM